MDEHQSVSGACLCGVVKISADAASTHVHACHCNMCRNWTGGPLMAIDCRTGVSIEGEEHVAVYSSSDWAERGFCTRCGTHLFYRLKQTGQYMMPVGIFRDIEAPVFDSQLFVDEKPGFYDFANSTRMLTGEQLFAQFSNTDDE